MKFLRIPLLAALLGGLLAAAAGCARQQEPPEETAAAGERDYGTEIADYASAHEKTMAGLAVAVFDRQGVLYRGNFGWSDLEAQKAVGEETVFEWGPVSRLLIWVSVMQQVEAGRLDLKADVRTYLPAGFPLSVRSGQKITLEHLMNQTAGFQDKEADRWLAGSGSVSLEEALRDHPPLQVREAGTAAADSDWGSALAAFIVERVSGESYAEYVRTHIFRVLGMLHTSILPDYSDSTFVQERRDLTASYTAKGRLIKKSRYYMPLYPSAMCTGTMDDFVLFARALIAGEGAGQLFSAEETREQMLLPTDLYTGGLPKNSHGLWHIYLGTRVMGHSGSTVGQTATLLFDPSSGTGVCVMTNQPQERVFTRGIPELIFGSYAAEPGDLPSLPHGWYRRAGAVVRGALAFATPGAGHLSRRDLASDYFVVSDRSGGGKRLEQPYEDWLSVSAAACFAGFLRRLLLPLAALGCAAYLVRGAAYQIRGRKRRVRERPEMVWLLILAEGLGDLLVIGIVLSMHSVKSLLAHHAASASFTLPLTFHAIGLMAVLVLMAVTALLFLQGKRLRVSHERLPAFIGRELLWGAALLCGWSWQMLPFWIW